LFVTQAGGSVLFAGTVNAAYLLLAVLTNLQMPSVLADRDRRPVFLVGLVLLAAGTLVYPLTGTLVAVLLLTVVRGVGWGVATVAGNTTVSEDRAGL
jgi:cyanate permease